MIPIQRDIGVGHLHHNNRLAARLKLHAGLDIHVFRKSILPNSDHHFLAPRTVRLFRLNSSLPALPYFKSKYSGLEAWNYLIGSDEKLQRLSSFRGIKNRSVVKCTFVVDGDRIALFCLRH